jgi:aspartyl protease family protein
MSTRPARLSLAALLLTGFGLVHAQQVVLTGVLGSRALLLVDGAGPHSLAVGERWRGVKLLALERHQAELDIGGQRTFARLGGVPANVGEPDAARRSVWQADARGHFVGPGRINGQLVQFMVDTGASTVALDAAHAQRLGIAYQQGRRLRLGTANGSAEGWAVRLTSLRIGTSELLDVEAVVVPQPMPYVLLGNNVLSRFQLHRGSQQLVMEQRY